MHRGLPSFIGESGSDPLMSSKSNSLPEVPQVVVVKSSQILLQLLPRFLNITIYIYKNECPCNAYECAKIVKVYF